MDLRQQRGLELAATKVIRRRGGMWIVPSATHEGSYVVDDEGSCTCPDYEKRQQHCKHWWAVEYARRRELNPDGTRKTTETLRIAYSQEWSKYNDAQVHEKERVAQLLRGLCDGIVQPVQKKGRPRLLLSDMVFAATMKVYGTLSGRRTDTDMREYAAKGLMSKAPHYNSIFNYLEDETLTPILKAMIEESASPMRALETEFAIDSTGFSTCNYVRWYDEKYGKERTKADWVKAHIMCGVRTHIVTSVEVTDRDTHDSTQFKPMLAATAKHFDVEEVSADKAYLSKANALAVLCLGATPYVPFKSNSRGGGPAFWRRLYHFFMYKRTEFFGHYHKRSNIETVNSMIKRKFGAALRSKTPTALTNELLCKVLCHNLCVLVSSISELGLEPTFWADQAPAQKAG